jgi:hypothetical protein
MGEGDASPKGKCPHPHNKGTQIHRKTLAVLLFSALYYFIASFENQVIKAGFTWAECSEGIPRGGHIH